MAAMEYLNMYWHASIGTEIQVKKSDILNLPGHWTTPGIPLSSDIADAANHHSAVTILGHGARHCHGVLDFQLIGGELGEEIQLRTYETNADGERLETHQGCEFNLGMVPIPEDSEGNPLYVKSTHHRYPIVAYINSGHYLKWEITAWGSPSKPISIRYIQFVANYFS